MKERGKKMAEIQNQNELSVKPFNTGKLIKSLLVCMPYLALALFFSIPGMSSGKTIDIVSNLISVAFVSTIFFMMVYTRKTDKFRAILFITMGLCFIFTFLTEFYELHGRFMVFTTGDMVNGDVGFCPIAIPNAILPIILGKTLLFPSKLSNMFMMLFIVAGLMLFGGRSWCSWNCFFSGLEEGISRCRKKPVIKKINRKWVYFSFALLLFVTFITPIILNPIYCDWLCPLKAVTEFQLVTTIQIALKTLVFVSLFIALVVILPFLTSKRAQCSFFCPFGAFLGLSNKISPFEIRIDRDKCIDCKKCINICPVYAIDEESLNKGKTCINCYKCGKCIDDCPKGAMHYHIKGTQIGFKANIARMMFLYPTMILYTMMGGGMISAAIMRILLLATTGSLLK